MGTYYTRLLLRGCQRFYQFTSLADRGAMEFQDSYPRCDQLFCYMYLLFEHRRNLHLLLETRGDECHNALEHIFHHGVHCSSPGTIRHTFLRLFPATSWHIRIHFCSLLCKHPALLLHNHLLKLSEFFSTGIMIIPPIIFPPCIPALTVLLR